MIKEVDDDGNQEIDFSEFLSLMARNMQDIEEEKVINTGFTVFDADGDGYISQEDLRTIMQSLGEQLTDDQLADIIREIDSTGEGRIDLHEFTEVINSKQ